MRVHFVTACRNVSRNAAAITRSLAEQTSDRWLWSVVDDASSDDTSDAFAYEAHNQGVSRVSITRSDERKHALRNIVETVRTSVEPGDIVATLDGDDALCNPRTVEILLEAYSTPANDVVWTSHRWDTNGMNISRAMPDRVDPYAWPWVTSHLRTFRADLLSRVSDENFKDTRGEWFKRGYDQALMLPVLAVGKGRVHIPEVCYLYNIDSSSIPAAERDWSEVGQISTVNIVRARGFLE